jgi:hypothetical protein
MGLLFIGGAGGRRRGGDQDITELLPVELSPLSFIEEETLLRIGTQGENHPVVRLPMGAEGGDPWRQLPPLLGVYLVSSLHEGARVLVEDQQGNPLIVTGGYGRGKVVAALAHSFWRLDLVSSGVGGKPQTIRQFWRDAVRWLATSAPVGRVRASTEQHVYQAGLPVVFAVQVFDELLRPQEGATLRLWVNDNEVFQLQDRGGGYYRGVYSGLGPGEYIYKVVAELNEEQIGQDEGRFIVEKHSIEWSDMRGNRMLLGELAQASGGATFALEAWPELLNKWSLRQRLVEEILELRLWGRVWPLVLLVLLLAAEWILRKRCGMI